jgi:uncharacterized protein (DUF849 family)
MGSTDASDPAVAAAAPSAATTRSVAIAVAPHGARRTKAEHPATPITPREIAYAAAASAEAGAAMIHVHVRDRRGEHVLDADIYRQTIAELRREVRGRMLVQITTDSIGRYRPAEQMAVVSEVRPEAVSLALRELCPNDAAETAFAEFLRFLKREHIAPQFILYDPDDVARLSRLVGNGVIPYAAPPVIHVLGRYQATAKMPEPADLLPYLNAAMPREVFDCFMVCAFSPAEAACGLAAALLGGDVRIGFENNLHLPDGRMAPDNAALIRAIAEPLADLNMAPAGIDEVRARYQV